MSTEPKIQPISPADVQVPPIPDAVLIQINTLIRARWNGHEVRVELDEVSGRNPTNLELRRWHAEIPDLYRKAGWQVTVVAPSNSQRDPDSGAFVFKKAKTYYAGDKD